IVKYSANGTPTWTNLFRAPNSNEDFPRGIVVDNANNSYITGNSRMLGSNTYATIKFSGNGAPQWTNYFTKVGTEIATGLVFDAATTMVVTGLARPGSGQLAYITIKYTTAGSGLWTNTLPAPDNANFPVVAADSAGAIFVVGNTPVPNFNLDTD